MAGETIITIVGNLTSDPELRFTGSGVAVATFTVASTPRDFKRDTNTWVDGETTFLKCNVWRGAAENAASSLKKGTKVLVQGRLKTRSYLTKEQEKRSVIELEVDAFGPELSVATAVVTRNARAEGQGSYSAPAAAVASAPLASENDDETPF